MELCGVVKYPVETVFDITVINQGLHSHGRIPGHEALRNTVLKATAVVAWAKKQQGRAGSMTTFRSTASLYYMRLEYSQRRRTGNYLDRYHHCRAFRQLCLNSRIYNCNKIQEKHEIADNVSNAVLRIVVLG